MSNLFSDLEVYIKIILILALFFIFIYEAINGFHDTANSVVTVIYTYTLRSHHAVIMSGIFNFLGVMLSGLSVAYTIIYLLPTYSLIHANANHILAMIFSMLSAAILWNLGTWYLGLPTSSSHTLIGTLIGIGLTNVIISSCSIMQGLNIPKLINIFLSLFISPIIGLVIAKTIMFALCTSWKKNKIHRDIHLTPSEQIQKKGTKHPSWKTRMILIISAAGVSFSHGANDGQKGIGLIMLLLIGVAPADFALNMHTNTHEISYTRDTINNFQKYYMQCYDDLYTIIPSEIISMPIPIILNQLKIIAPSVQKSTEIFIQENSHENIFDLNSKKSIKNFFCDISLTLIVIHNTSMLLNNIDNYAQLNVNQRIQIRQSLMYITDIIDQIIFFSKCSPEQKIFLKNSKKHLIDTIEYAPIWIIFTVALSLSLGTIIGWKRVVLTIGEKIGKKEMTYAQGLSAQLTTAISIGTASYIGFPVSTTHILSASITGSMLIPGCGIQKKTIKNILITWLLTLPVSIILSGSFYWITLKTFCKYISTTL